MYVELAAERHRVERRMLHMEFKYAFSELLKFDADSFYAVIKPMEDYKVFETVNCSSTI